MFDLIPNSLYEILANNDVLDFEIFKSNLGFDKAEIINEYESFLLDKQYIFTTKDLNLFPKLSLRWETPVLITNGIIELKEESSPYSLRELLPQFSQIGLQHLEVRLSQLKSYTYFENLLNGIEETNIFSIVLYLNNEIGISESLLKMVMLSFKRFTNIYLYNNPESSEDYFFRETQTHVVYLKTTILSRSSCGTVHPNDFAINIPHFTEALTFNTCLNRKISIDEKGNIRNCPSMIETYGNVNTIKLIDAIQQKEFQKYWHIKKDDISICKDCEFRYICTDCRAYLEDPENMLSKPLKCGYNPYNFTWDSWSESPIKQKVIETYQLRELNNN